MKTTQLNIAQRDLNRLTQWVAALVALTVSMLSWAADPRLQDTRFVALPGHKTEIRFDFDQPPPVPQVYMIDSPARLVIDFWGVTNEQAERLLAVDSGVVTNLNFAQAQGRLRVVANLTDPADYRTYTEGNSLFIELADARMAAGSQEEKIPSAQRAAAPIKAAADDGTRVRGIDFERLEGGVGRVTITLSDDQAGLDIIEEGNNVVVNLLGAGLAGNLEQRVDVQAFATPVLYIDSMMEGGNTAILVKPSSEPFDYMAYQTGQQLVLDFKPVTAQDLADSRADLFPFTGEEIDLNFQNVEIRSVLQIIAEVAEKNLVVGDEVGGTITLRLKNVPWDQALDIILKTNGLDKRIVGNVMLVGGAQQIADREQQEMEAQQQVRELAPLVTEYIQIDFRAASEIKSFIEDANLVSERGFMLADDQTNILMVRETSLAINEIRQTIRRFDREVAQIMVEARLVAARKEFSENLGINWGLFKQTTTSGGTDIEFGFGGPGAVFGTTSIPNALAIDYGGGAAAPGFAIGILKNSLLLTAELSALESTGNGEVISQPKVITTNGTEASIATGETILVPAGSDENGNANTEEVDATLSLTVTPQVTPGDRVALKLTITEDSINDSGNIDTTTLNTTVVVQDGDTIVLGGVFKTNTSARENKVPLLGDVPVIGRAFRSNQKVETKDELLIFITPKLIREALALQ